MRNELYLPFYAQIVSLRNAFLSAARNFAWWPWIGPTEMEFARTKRRAAAGLGVGRGVCPAPSAFGGGHGDQVRERWNSGLAAGKAKPAAVL
jgi:hypothetical protein